MAAERNFFHRWRGMTTIGYELGVIWEMSVKAMPLSAPKDAEICYLDFDIFGTLGCH